MMCSYEPSTYIYRSIHNTVDIMLSFDNQLIEEVIGSMGTTGLPYWTAADRLLQWLSCMMYKIETHIAQAFSRRHATVAPSYHGLFVFRRECRWFYITWLCCSCGYCWRYTLWKFDSSIVSNFCVLRGAYVQKSPECKYFVVHILFTVHTVDYPEQDPPWGLNISARLGSGGLTPEKFVWEKLV